MDSYREINGRKYLTVTLFLVNLSYVENIKNNGLDFSEINLSGESLENIGFIGCAPNGLLESDYYDKFFRRGKSGYEEGVPKDARISYVNSSTPMKFDNLDRDEARGQARNP